MPKEFTPNNDGQNDRVLPFLVGIKQITCFKIFNRRGNLVFQINEASPQNGWDGRLNVIMQEVHGLFDNAARGIFKNGDISISIAFNKGLDRDGNHTIGLCA